MKTKPAKAQVKLKITETEPVPIVKDFDTFVMYLTGHDFTLSKNTQLITSNHVYEINQLMSHPNLENTPRTQQEFYPLIHLFYHLALSGKLFSKAPAGSQKMKLQKTERLGEYMALTPTEKYFFLLETFWVDCKWNKLATNRLDRYPFFEVEQTLNLIAKSTPGKAIPNKRSSDYYLLDGGFLRYLSFFGFFEVTRDEEAYQLYPSKRDFPVSSLTPSVLGVALAPVLKKERPLEKWNLPLRRSDGENASFPGLEVKEQSEERYVPFFAPFTKFFELGALQRTLPRKERAHTEGVFIFKVALSRDIWRKIAVPSDHTLHSLHLAIQDAFKFDNDHLYAFFMDGKRWSDDCFNSPDSDDGPFADEESIGDLDLIPNQQFLYLFDFGDEWQFQVKLLEISDKYPELQEPTIIESHGKAPPQYRYNDY